jgi:integrase
MKRAGPNLSYHGRKYYLKLGIPRSLRRYFLTSSGKPKSHIIEPLSDSFELAKLKAAQRAAECLAVFDAVKAGAITTPAQAAAALAGGGLAVDEEGNPVTPASERAERDTYRRFADEVREVERRLEIERQAARFEAYGRSGDFNRPAAAMRPAPSGETISQAAATWYAELTRDKSTAPRETTIDGHKRRVQAFIDAVGDVPLTDVTGIMASDFLAGLKVSNRTRNNYCDTLNYVFKYAAKRSRFSKAEEDNPFYDQRSKVGKSSYSPFTVAELQTLFDALPREIKPAKHSPDSALPWAALIALYSGMRLEEIAQLKTGDVREENANGATVTIIDVHNGGSNNLKNEISERFVPVHSELVRLGLLDYVKALKPGPLFPGLVRRESKGGKVGARLGELFRKKLVALGIKREGLCFHSLRHNVATALRRASVPQEDAAPVLGHAVEGESYGTYAQAGPGLINVKATVEKIKYAGLRV